MCRQIGDSLFTETFIRMLPRWQLFLKERSHSGIVTTIHICGAGWRCESDSDLYAGRGSAPSALAGLPCQWVSSCSFDCGLLGFKQEVLLGL